MLRITADWTIIERMRAAAIVVGALVRPRRPRGGLRLGLQVGEHERRGSGDRSRRSLPPERAWRSCRSLPRRKAAPSRSDTSLSGGVVQDIVDAFTDATDVDVALYRASNETVEQRILEEADADFHGADVVDTSGQSLLVLDEKKLVADYPFDPAPLIDGAVHDGWAATRLQRFVVAWNTKNAKRPASWEALGDPA